MVLSLVNTVDPLASPDCARRPTYLRLSVTDRCDLRCVYCGPHGDASVSSELLSVVEIAVLVRAFADNGVTKVRITGGEPLLREDIIDVAKAVARTPGITGVGLTTNGLRLPELGEGLARAGVQRLNISLDSLEPDTYRRITGSPRLGDALDGLRAAMDCGFSGVKTNTVVMRGINDNEISSIASLARDLPIDVRFIELMPLGRITAQWRSLYVPAQEIRRALGDLNALPAVDGESARLYELEGHMGRIGIISPVSRPFCKSCSRVRVTSRGVLMPCLRSAAALDIRPLLARPDPTHAIGDALRWCEAHKHRAGSHEPDPLRISAMSAVGG